MITVGEETGELSKMLKHVSAFYQNHIEVFMKRFATAIEPFMLVFMGLIIGLLLLPCSCLCSTYLSLDNSYY